MKTALTFIFAIFICSGSWSACGNSLPKESTEQEDLFVLLSNLLSVNQQRHTYLDPKGQPQIDHLKAYRELEDVYIKYINSGDSNGAMESEKLKIVMFLAFYAESRNSAAINEALATDLMPIYRRNKTVFLSILNELPFLTSANCDRLNASFGFEGNTTLNKSGFIKDNKPLFKKYLAKNQLKICMGKFD